MMWQINWKTNSISEVLGVRGSFPVDTTRKDICRDCDWVLIELHLEGG